MITSRMVSACNVYGWYINAIKDQILQIELIFQTASNLATGHSKSQKEKNSNSKYAVWAAEQIIDKYQVIIMLDPT